MEGENIRKSFWRLKEGKKGQNFDKKVNSLTRYKIGDTRCRVVVVPFFLSTFFFANPIPSSARISTQCNSLVGIVEVGLRPVAPRKSRGLKRTISLFVFFFLGGGGWDLRLFFLFSFFFFFLNTCIDLSKFQHPYFWTSFGVGLPAREIVFDPPPPPNFGIFGGKICQRTILKYLREFLFNFNAHTLLFSGLFRTFVFL